MKILNDPIYGFITVPHPQVLTLIDKTRMRYELTGYVLRVRAAQRVTRNPLTRN